MPAHVFINGVPLARPRFDEWMAADKALPLIVDVVRPLELPARPKDRSPGPGRRPQSAQPGRRSRPASARPASSKMKRPQYARRADVSL